MHSQEGKFICTAMNLKALTHTESRYKFNEHENGSRRRQMRKSIRKCKKEEF